MNDTVSVGKASLDALTEVCRAQSMKLDAARERIAELETIIAIQETELDAKNKTIAGRVRKGFQTGDKVIRPELVAVYAVKKPS